MPEALPAKLVEQAKALFYQGVAFPEIAKQLSINPGTLRGWSTKQGWKLRKEEARQSLEQTGRATMALETARDLATQSKRVREQLSDELTAQVKTLRDKPHKYSDLPGKYGRASTALTIANTAAKVFGWSEQGNKSVINIGTLNQLKLMDDSSEQVANPSSEQSEAIDV